MNRKIRHGKACFRKALPVMAAANFFLFFLPALLFAQSGRGVQNPDNAAETKGPALDREPGRLDTEPAWRQALGGAVTGLPTVQARSVVVILDGGNIKAYSTGGRPLWNYAARGKLSPFVTRSPEGTSYISQTNGNFFAVNRAGREIWRLRLDNPLSGQVICGWDGRIFVPTGKKISCYTASGHLLWERSFDEQIDISPALEQSGGIILSLEKDELLRISPFGTVRRFALPSPPQSLTSLRGAEGARKVLVLYKNGNAEFVDYRSMKTAAELAEEAGEARPAEPEQNLVFRLPAPPLAAAGRGSAAAVTLNDGRVALISGQDGSLLWSGDSHIRIAGRSAGAEDRAAMIYDERGIYVLSKSGATGFTEDGRRLWFTLLNNAAYAPAFGDDGMLYSGGADWILYAYKLEDRARQQDFSLYGPAPEGSYGTGAPPPSSWADYYFRFDETELNTRLDIISRAIYSGAVGPDELEYTAYLMETAEGEYNRPQASQTHPPVQVAHRLRALRLLGLIGSRETIPYLAKVFSGDRESLIKAAAAEAIGNIGCDPEGLALQAFGNAVFPPGTVRDEQVLTAIASAAGALCRFSGPPLSDRGVRLLNLLAGENQPPIVQRRARREIGTLKF
ncbi:MAG: PQQ-binding-like beta-propeller repeat protein [Treponema sp.]|nr:PQQ-binding-like beta-propeller repeat protein [Treponema sp.]